MSIVLLLGRFPTCGLFVRGVLLLLLVQPLADFLGVTFVVELEQAKEDSLQEPNLFVTTATKAGIMKVRTSIPANLS